MPTFQHAIGQGRASCGWGSPLFRVEDEGDGRNDVRVAHTRPIVAKGPVELPSGQMLPRRRDRAGTRTWRSLTSPAAIALLHLPRARLQISRPIWGKFGRQSGPDYRLRARPAGGSSNQRAGLLAEAAQSIGTLELDPVPKKRVVPLRG